MSVSQNITPQIIVQFERVTGLTFISDDTSEGNVCFANNPELRPEFKSTFRKSDIKNYLLGLSQSKKKQKITLPKDAQTFWKIVGFGKELYLKSK